MSLRCYNRIIVGGLLEDRKLVLDFMKSEMSRFDIHKLLSTPTYIRLESEPTEEMLRFLYWMQICKYSIYTSDAVLDPEGTFRPDDTFIPDETGKHPFIFVDSEWRLLRQMFHNIKNYGAHDWKHWIFNKHGFMISEDFHFVEGYDNIIEGRTIRNGVHDITLLLSEAFPLVPFTLLLETSHRKYLKYDYYDGEFTVTRRQLPAPFDHIELAINSNVE